MDSQELLNTIFLVDHPAFREVDLPILSLDVPVPFHVLNRRRNAIACNNTTRIMDVTKQQMSRRGAISYTEDHDVARFVRGHSELVVHQEAVSCCRSVDTRLQVTLTINDMVATDRRHSRRGSLLSTNTANTPALISTAGTDLELIDINRMCMEANMVCINSWDFDVFAFRRMTKGHPLLYMGLYLFNYHNLVDKFSLDPLKLRKFLTIVEANYSPTNCYHNSTHASDVAQAVHCLISDKKIYRALTSEEVLATIIAALCHDLDHPGVNVDYLVNTCDYLTVVHHGKKSMLEHHHCQTTKGALADSGLLNHVSSETIDAVISLVDKLILATDVACHADYLERFQARLDAESLIDLADGDNRHLVLTMALKAADISNPARTFHLSKLWSESIMEEFFRQGDLEKEKHMTVSALCDRCTTAIPKSQSYFFKMVALPMFQTWDKYVHSMLSKMLCNNITTNKLYWDRLMNSKADKQ